MALVVPSGLVAALIAVALGVGVRLVPLRREPFDSAVLSAVAAVLVGLGVIATALLTAGFAAGVTATSVATVMVLAVVVSISALRRAVDLCIRAVREFGETASLVGVVSLVLLGLALWLMSVAAPVDFDSLMYHLRGPELFIREGRFYAPDGNAHIAFIGMLHTLYLPMLLLAEPSAPAVLQGALLLLAVVAGLTATDRWFGTRSGWLLPLFVFGGPMLIRVASTSMVDAGTTAYLLVGQILLLASHRRRHDEPSLLVMAGLLLGLAVGTKILAAAYVAATLGTLRVADIVAHGRALPWRRSVLLVATGLALGASPWLMRTAALYGTPTYPYLVAPAVPAWAASAEPALELPTGSSTLRSVRQPFSLMAWIRSPERLTPEGDGHLFGLNPVFLALVLVLFVPRRREYLLVVVPPILYAILVVAWSRYVNLRYFVPIFLPLTMASAAALVGASMRLPARARIVAIGAFAVLTLASPAGDLWWESVNSERPQAALGLLDANKYLSRHDETVRLRTHLNTELPPEARILFLFEARAFGIRRDVVQDNLMENWRLLRGRIADGPCLEGLGFTHVVMGNSTLAYFRARGLDDEHLDLPVLNDFVSRCMEGGVGDRTHTVFSVRAAPPPA